MNISGSKALMEALLNEGVDTIFGYPGGSIIPVFDALYDYMDKFHYVLTRHEQGATHAAQGYARIKGKPGVCIVTSGPGATNTITGIADAMLDSTPLVVITGQVNDTMLGTDAFQETDLIGITLPISKWSYQIRDPKEIAFAVAKAFYIAGSGRPGPVVLDITKNAQSESVDFKPEKCDFIRSYLPNVAIDNDSVDNAAALINNAKKPFAIVGHGVTIGEAETELREFLDKADIPAAWTIMGESAMPTDYRLNKGMVGMHGNIAPNTKTNECDVLIAIGMRFADRVTGNLHNYARQAKVIHLEIDPAEINKNVKSEIAVLGDVKLTLPAITAKLQKQEHKEWIDSFAPCEQKEMNRVISKELYPDGDEALKMGEVVRKISEATGGNAILVTDVGQNQMAALRYFQFKQKRSVVTSGGAGTMGFGIPAAIGAKIAAPDRTVCLFCGDGGFQMTMQELGTIIQENTGVKMILLNNNYLGMVRQQQELFFNKRYSSTPMLNPDFCAVAKAYNIATSHVTKREELSGAIKDMLKDDKPYLLVVEIEENGLVLPMVPPGKGNDDIIV
ncbi:MAG: biosynthetic-type acetolactate synthase large subunit [Paludibacteraceae bacterium]|nr:biosynthetic-type acetolactate synthase large subunit [Paludibacteraceae bacterium]